MSNTESDFLALLDALHVFTGRGADYAQFFIDRPERGKEALGRAMQGYSEIEVVPIDRIARELDWAMREGQA